MSRVNISEASKEQLIDIVRQLRKQIKDARAATTQPDGVATKELQDQIMGFQGLLQEKNDEIQALRMQCRMLTEKSASDESTISTLFKRLEELKRGEKTVVKEKVASGGDTATATSSGSEAAAGHSATIASLSSQVASYTATVAAKNDEIVKLETQVRELMEVNSFYSAIVSQHDREERERRSASAALAKKRGAHMGSEDTATDGPCRAELMKRVAVLEDQRDDLQRVLRQLERERSSAVAEIRHYREELSRLSEEMLEVERWQRISSRKEADGMTADAKRYQAATSASAVGGGSGPEPSSSRNSIAPERVPATVFSPSLASLSVGTSDGRQMAFSPLSNHAPLSRGARGSRGVADSSRAHTGAHSYSGLSRGATTTWSEIRVLKPISIRSPDPQERELLHRISLYERHFAEMEEFEADRQKSFDAMETSRAQLFATMNDQLEKQRREIHNLKKQLGSFAKRGDEMSNSQSTVGQATRDAAVSPLLPRGGVDVGVVFHPEVTGQSDTNEASVIEERRAQAPHPSVELALFREEELSRLRLELAVFLGYTTIATHALASAEEHARSASSRPLVLGSIEAPSPNGTTSVAERGYATSSARESREELRWGEGEGEAALDRGDPVLGSASLDHSSAAELLVRFRDSRLGDAVDTLLEMYGESLKAFSTSLRAGARGFEKDARTGPDSADWALILSALRGRSAADRVGSGSPTHEIGQGRRPTSADEEDGRGASAKAVGLASPVDVASADASRGGSSAYPHVLDCLLAGDAISVKHDLVGPTIHHAVDHVAYGTDGRVEREPSGEALTELSSQGQGVAQDTADNDAHADEILAGSHAELGDGHREEHEAVEQAQVSLEAPLSGGPSHANMEASPDAEVDESVAQMSPFSLYGGGVPGAGVALSSAGDKGLSQHRSGTGMSHEDDGPGTVAGGDGEAAAVHPDGYPSTTQERSASRDACEASLELGSAGGVESTPSETPLSPGEEADLLAQLERAVASDGKAAAVLSFRADDPVQSDAVGGGAGEVSGPPKVTSRCEGECEGADGSSARSSPPPAGVALAESGDGSTNPVVALSNGSSTSTSSSRETSSFPDKDGVTERTRGPPPVPSSADDMEEIALLQHDGEDGSVGARGMTRVQTAEGFDSSLSTVSPLAGREGMMNGSEHVTGAEFSASLPYLHHTLGRGDPLRRIGDSSAAQEPSCAAMTSIQTRPFSSLSTDPPLGAATEAATPGFTTGNTPSPAVEDRASFLSKRDAVAAAHYASSSSSDDDDGGAGTFRADFNPFA